MRNGLTMTCSALLIALPAFAFAQTSGTGTGMESSPGTSVPSASQPKTPGVGTPSMEGRSSSTMPPSDPRKPDTDGLHPSGEKLDNTTK